jgi:uncharacterized membrane protein
VEGEKLICQICGKSFEAAQLISAELVRPSVVELIRKTHPDWSPSGYICMTDLSGFRSRLVESLLEAEVGELSDLEREVVQSMHDQEVVSQNVDAEYARHLSFGERLADRIASFGGSWRFIMIFTLVLIVWISVNSVLALRGSFDPYPFILLNLVLSCLAAVQAPVIMMSQNRQEAKDRLRAENDYQVNLRAELEIRMLTERIEHLLHHQWRHLMEIQQLQTDLMEELARSSSGSA